MCKRKEKQQQKNNMSGSAKRNHKYPKNILYKNGPILIRLKLISYNDNDKSVKR